MTKPERIPRFRKNREIAKRLKTVRFPTDAYGTYDEFIRNLNIGLFQAENEEWHQVMNQLVLATKDAMALLAGDSQDECLEGKLRALVDGDVDEKLTRYNARTVDRILAKVKL